MRETLEQLCLRMGVSSREDEVRAYIEGVAREHADSLRTDALGNLIVFKNGRKATGETLMLAAHMDEVGLMIRGVTEEGYLKFVTIGGIDRRVLIGKKVLVGDRKLPGVIGLKAYHLVSKEEEKKVPKLTEYYIDIGAENRAQALTLVTIGDVAAFAREFSPMGADLIAAPALDDRIGCGVLLELMKGELPLDCTFVFTVQEEVGTRGAFGAAFSVRPELALILEGTTAADLPSVEEHKQVCVPGQGPVIPFMDGATVYDRGLFAQLRDLAVAHQIPWQTKHLIAGGTDGGAIQRSRDGVRVAGISAAVRYLHAPSSVASLTDYENMIRLASLFLDAVAASC